MDERYACFRMDMIDAVRAKEVIFNQDCGIGESESWLMGDMVTFLVK